ncbi:MAG: hypothetical protein WCD89_04845 [Anaerocolumna sp.]
MSTGFSGNQFFIPHISKFVGQTVTVFTTSGGLSGSGFTGVVLAVNCDFIRLVIKQGSAPINPLNVGYDDGCNGRKYRDCCYRAGAVVDIPFDRISSFVHNAI